MAKGNKRKPDLRKIRTTKVYRPCEIASDLSRNVQTINGWIKDGLPILSPTGPVLIEGTVLKGWLKDRSDSKKHKCLPNEFFCMKCKQPRTPSFGSISFHAQNAKTLRVKALCARCGTCLNKVVASADLAQVQAVYQQIHRDKPHLEGCADPSLNSQYLARPVEASKQADGGGHNAPDHKPKSGCKLH